MGVYDSQIELAQRLIQEKGQAIQLVRKPVSTDVDEPWETSEGAPVTTPTFGVFLPFNRQDYETHHRIGDTEIQVGDVKVLVAGDLGGSAPSIGDKLRVTSSGVVYSIEWVQTLAPNGEQVLYTLRARK